MFRSPSTDIVPFIVIPYIQRGTTVLCRTQWDFGTFHVIGTIPSHGDGRSSIIVLIHRNVRSRNGRDLFRYLGDCGVLYERMMMMILWMVGEW